jgi:hypothetical protein
LVFATLTVIVVLTPGQAISVTGVGKKKENEGVSATQEQAGLASCNPWPLVHAMTHDAMWLIRDRNGFFRGH